jgi:hypothetical protein
MTTVNLDRANDPVSVSFVNDVGLNMCNIIYGSDVVPRAYANATFILAVVKNAIPQLLKGHKIPRFLQHWLDKKIDTKVRGAIQSQGDLIKIAEYFRHIGKVIHYEDEQSIPVTYIDKGFHYSKPKGSTQKLFYDLEYKESDDVVTTLLNAHLITVRGPGLAYGLPPPKKTK